VGSNADCKADVLYQFAVLGSLYSQTVFGVDKPRVALLNIGEEESKGNLLTLAAHKIMAESDEIHFIGNIEGRDIFSGKADVIVCDGFTGNIVLKQAEGIYTLMKQRGIHDEYFERFNYENYGGTPILGVKGNVIIGHGISNSFAVKNMILHAYEVARSGLAMRVNEAFNGE
jgi:glycerol-3-phosphate acyltransferase PlsX